MKKILIVALLLMSLKAFSQQREPKGEPAGFDIPYYLGVPDTCGKPVNSPVHPWRSAIMADACSPVLWKWTPATSTWDTLMLLSASQRLNLANIPVGKLMYWDGYNLRPAGLTVDSILQTIYGVTNIRFQAQPKLVPVIPKMTKDTLPKPFIASADSYFGDHNPYRSFDSTDYGWINNAGSPAYLKIDLGGSYIATAFSLRKRTTTNNEMVTNGIFQGSYDNLSWDNLDTLLNEPSFASGESRTYTFKNMNAYRYYRLYITLPASVIIGQMQVFVNAYDDIVNINDTTKAVAIHSPLVILDSLPYKPAGITVARIVRDSTGKLYKDSSTIAGGSSGGTSPSGTGYAKYSGTTPTFYPQIPLGTDVSGTLSIANGGWGINSFTSGYHYYYNGSAFAASPLFSDGTNLAMGLTSSLPNGFTIQKGITGSGYAFVPRYTAQIASNHSVQIGFEENSGIGVALPRLYFNYPSNSNGGNAGFVNKFNGASQFFFGMGNEGVYGGTANSPGGRYVSFYDYVSGAYRWGIDANGNMYVGSSNSSYGARFGQAGGTSLINTPLTTFASSASAAGFNIPTGTAPTTPVNGDVWQTGGHVYMRLNGVTYQLDQQSGGSSGITALTGDATASGTGSVPITLATVNSNVGTFTYPSVTVNAKGLITAISNGTAPTNYWLRTGGGLYPATQGDFVSIADASVTPDNGYNGLFRLTGATGRNQYINLVKSGTQSFSIGYLNGSSQIGFGGGQGADANYTQANVPMFLDIAGNYVGIKNLQLFRNAGANTAWIDDGSGIGLGTWGKINLANTVSGLLPDANLASATQYQQAYNKYPVSGTVSGTSINFLSRDGSAAFTVSGLPTSGTSTYDPHHVSGTPGTPTITNAQPTKITGVSVTGNDGMFKITFTVAAGLQVDGTMFTISYGAAFDSAPGIFIQSASSNATGLQFFANGTSTTAGVIGGYAITEGTSYIISVSSRIQ